MIPRHATERILEGLEDTPVVYVQGVRQVGKGTLVRDLANIERLTDMPRLLALLASRVGQLINYADLARTLAIPQTTLKRHMALLEISFLVRPLHCGLGGHPPTRYHMVGVPFTHSGAVALSLKPNGELDRPAGSRNHPPLPTGSFPIKPAQWGRHVLLNPGGTWLLSAQSRSVRPCTLGTGLMESNFRYPGPASGI